MRPYGSGLEKQLAGVRVVGVEIGVAAPVDGDVELVVGVGAESWLARVESLEVDRVHLTRPTRAGFQAQGERARPGPAMPPRGRLQHLAALVARRVGGRQGAGHGCF